MQTLFAGFRYIWSEKIVLGAISLDLFAVLLSGAAALLPVYARDILHTRPLGPRPAALGPRRRRHLRRASGWPAIRSATTPA